ncbi:hypothetical protein PA08_2767 [Cutibacterium modestum P08]|nr:hypothetical protein PA08_2767 [Cutibacterium modestum P08]
MVLGWKGSFWSLTIWVRNMLIAVGMSMPIRSRVFVARSLSWLLVRTWTRVFSSIVSPFVSCLYFYCTCSLLFWWQ